MNERDWLPDYSTTSDMHVCVFAHECYVSIVCVAMHIRLSVYGGAEDNFRCCSLRAVPLAF